MCMIFLRVLPRSGIAGSGVNSASDITSSWTSSPTTLHFDYYASASLTSSPWISQAHSSLQIFVLVVLPTWRAFPSGLLMVGFYLPFRTQLNTTSSAQMSLSLVPHLNEPLPFLPQSLTFHSFHSTFHHNQK